MRGNHYFPAESVWWDYFSKTRLHTVCPWKGIASYYSLTVGGVTRKNAAWTYRRPLPLARKIKGHGAFSADIVVSDGVHHTDWRDWGTA